MIPKINRSGRSFSGLAQYLAHDPNAQTSDRVAWTHTENLANDHVPAAVNEMLWTYRDAELLKQEAGVRAGGRPAQRPVKHVSLNWAPSDNPSQRHMIETGKHYLKYMGWEEHQAIFIAHNDKEYKHLHIMINEIHPETGLRLNDSLEWRRSQKWAHAYEIAQGQVHCKQRELDPAEREPNMPRDQWTAFKKSASEFEGAEQKLRKRSENESTAVPNKKDSEWEILKEWQRSDREEFFKQGKIEFRALRADIYREAREEFRERWAAYYEASGLEADPKFLERAKKEIIADQKAYLEPRRDIACKELLKLRDSQYEELLSAQQKDRDMLAWHQKNGLDASVFFHSLGTRRGEETDYSEKFKEVAFEVTTSESTATPKGSWTPAHDAIAEAGDFAEAGFRSIGSFGGAFFDAIISGFLNLGSAPPSHQRYPGERPAFAVAAEEATKQIQREQQQRYDEEWRQRSKQSYGE